MREDFLEDRVQERGGGRGDGGDAGLQQAVVGVYEVGGGFFLGVLGDGGAGHETGVEGVRQGLHVGIGLDDGLQHQYELRAQRAAQVLDQELQSAHAGDSQGLQLVCEVPQQKSSQMWLQSYQTAVHVAFHTDGVQIASAQEVLSGPLEGDQLVDDLPGAG